MTSPPPLLEAQHITRRLPEGVTLVADASVKVERGEFIAITGPSGSGKSSLLYLLGLLIGQPKAACCWKGAIRQA